MNASGGYIGSDSAKVDADGNTAEDYAEIPELDEAFFARALLHRNGSPLNEARTDPTSAALTLRVDPEVVARFRAAGPGWEQRMEDVLRRAVGL